MRSVVVVLPASMWAMIPMLRVFSRGNSRAISCFLGGRSVVAGIESQGVSALDRAYPIARGPVGDGGPGPLGVTSRSASFGRLPCHCSDHHDLIGPFERFTHGNAQKLCLIPPFSGGPRGA